MLENELSEGFIGQVFAHKLKFIVGVLSKNGISERTLLKDTNIAPLDLADCNYKINKEQIIPFYRNVLALQVPNISVLLGSGINVNDYGLYGCTLLCCKGLQSTLEYAIRYHSLATKTVNMSLILDNKNELACFRLEDLLHAEDLIEFNIELQCAIVLSLIRQCLDDKNFVFDEMRLSFKKPKNHQLFAAHFECPVTYQHKYSELVLSNSKLKLATPRSNPFAMPLLLDQCDLVLNSIAAKNEFLITINQWVAANMHKELCAQELASYLCITERTLRRRLSEQNTSFRSIVQELRCEAAKKLILATEITIEDVGYSIGFSDVSNFRAAFKKWTGKTPSSLRP